MDFVIWDTLSWEVYNFDCYQDGKTQQADSSTWFLNCPELDKEQSRILLHQRGMYSHNGYKLTLQSTLSDLAH